MQRKVVVGFVLLVLALLVGGVAAYFTNQYIEQRKQAFRAEIRSEYELVPVVVPGRDLAAGERLVKREMLVREIPKKFVTSTAILPREFDQYGGKTVRVPVARGTPLVSSFVGDPGSSAIGSFSRSVPEEMRALTVAVSGTSAIAGLLVPGDRVDMLIQTRGPEGSVLLPLIGNVEILATGSQAAVTRDQRANNQYRSVTVKVTPKQARQITEGQQLGNLVVTLRNPGDDTPMLDEATTAEDVFNGRFADYIGAERKPDRGPQVEIIQGVSPSGRSDTPAGGAGSAAAQREFMRQLQQMQQIQQMQQSGMSTGGAR
ncbi:MAG: Flp pilus assembly protein CpaB [Halofilum sp. (in: g-proteobacteria)]|nr:Flp pilus assembly protein CpaB [Halofilum sp. (in: g-proteobacteria)]